MIEWVVIGADGQRFVFDDWHEAAEKYTSLVWEWAEIQDKFAETMGHEDPHGWTTVNTLETDRFGEDLTPYTEMRIGLEIGDGFGGGALFRPHAYKDGEKVITARIGE